MKTSSFRCLPEQLYEWARQSQGIAPEIHVGLQEATEILFTTLFPNIRNHQNSGLCLASGTASSYKKNSGSGEQSVEIRPFYRRVGGGDMKVLTVTITDTTNGTKALVEAVSKIGLLQGDNLIKKKEEEVIALRKQQMAIETQRILYFFTGAFSLLAIFVLFVRLNS